MSCRNNNNNNDDDDDDNNDNGAENVGRDHDDDDYREKTCEFTMPNMTDTWYGFFESPSMKIVSIRRVGGAKNRWRVETTARVAYCANVCPNPTLKFCVSFKTQDKRKIAGEIVYNIVENAQTVATKATVTVSGSEEKATIDKIDKTFLTPQKPFRAFCDEYGSQFRTHLTIQATLAFDISIGDADGVSAAASTAADEKKKKEEEEKAKANQKREEEEGKKAKQKKEEEEEEKAEAKRKKEEEEEERNNECCICMDAQATMVNEICKHTVMCHTCAFAFLARSEKSEQPYLCPVCRAAIGNMYIDTKSIKAK